MRFLLRSPIYYGWYIAGVALLGAFFSASTAQVFLGTMLKPMTEEFGWTRTAAAGAVTIGSLASGLISPFVGRLVDRHGPRVLSVFGGTVVVLTLVGLAFVEQLWQFYLIYLFGRAVSATMMSGVVPATAIANWFRRKRGRVMGLLTTAFAAGASVLVFTGQSLITSYGWRTAYLIIAAVVAVIFIPLAWLVLRRRPEDLGLRPDGDPPEATTAEAKAGAAATVTTRQEFSWTPREAMRTSALWLMTFGMFLGVTGTSGIAFHQIAYYTDMGVAAAAAAAAVSLYSMSAAISSVVWGFLSERFTERYLAGGAMLFGAVVIVTLIFVRTPVAAMICGALFGVASRGETTIINILIAQYYGRDSYGAINGILTPFSQTGLGIGPVVASLFFDFTGSYHTGFIVFAVCYLLAGICFTLARKPELPKRAFVEAAASS